MTFVFDNGGSSATSQNWSAADLRCTIWAFNTGGTLVYTQDLVGTPPLIMIGTVSTDGAGVLTSNFTDLVGAGVTTNYTVTGGAMGTTFTWFANDANGIFDDGVGALSAVTNGVPMAPANWSNPVPFAGNCAGVVLGAVATPTQSIPTLSEWAMILMSGLLGVAGFGALRRRS